MKSKVSEEKQFIKYGISKNYLSDWTIQDAIREIYQNFLDFGEYNLEAKEDNHGYIDVKFTNDFEPENLNFLAIGESGKRNDSSTIGKHGEGLKMAFLVLARESCIPELTYKNYTYEGTFYYDENLGECFGLDLFDLANNNRSSVLEPFTVTFRVPKEDWEVFAEKEIKEEDIIYHNSYHGDLVNKNPGDIYVGGLYVCNLPNMRHAYNFPPERIELDRDRKVPRSFDVEYNASMILQASERIEIEDLYTRDTSYINKVPEKVSKKFKPIKNKDGRIKFQIVSGPQKGEYASETVTGALMNNPLQQKRVEKLKYSVSRKKTPENLLKEFAQKYSYKISSDKDMQIDFNILLKKSKNWKVN